MKFLAVSAGLHAVHHDILGGHKGKLGHHVLLDNLRIDHKAVHHIQVQIENAVHRQESFRNAQALVGGIIEGSLKPLGGCHQHPQFSFL